MSSASPATEQSPLLSTVSATNASETLSDGDDGHPKHRAANQSVTRTRGVMIAASLFVLIFLQGALTTLS